MRDRQARYYARRGELKREYVPLHTRPPVTSVRNAAYSASMIWLATCASASGAGNGLLACPSALPGLESIAQLCRQAVRDRRGHDALVRRQQTRRLRRVPRRLGLHVRSGGIRRADAEREGLSTGGDTSDPEPLPGMSTSQLRPHPVRCKRVHPAWSKGATIRSASEWPLPYQVPSRPQRAGVVSAVTALRAASAEATATMAVTRLIRDAFCDCVSCHQANPIPKASVHDTKAVTVPATATGCCLVCGHR